MTSTTLDATTLAPFDLSAPLVHGRVVLEASAGTGKTYSLTNLAVRHLVEAAVTTDQLLVVTYTRAAANELRDRARTSLMDAYSVLTTGEVPDDHPWMAVLLQGGDREVELRARRAREALARFDDATITTIHGFCQQALAQAGLRSGSDPDATLVENADDIVAEVCRDFLIDGLALEPHRLSPRNRAGVPQKSPKQVETAVVAAVKALIANPAALVVPGPGCDEIADRWVRVVTEARAEIRARQDSRGEVGYDRLVTDLHDALVHPQDGVELARQLADRFAVVLVDEFQDTDRTQWTIFERAFPGRAVVTVGDPKQAIYRFRGADVHAYLSAIASHRAQSLPVNHRSDRQLLAGLERIFAGATLGDERIPFSPVQAAPTAVDNALGAGASVHLRMVREHADLLTADGKNLAMPLVRQLVVADLVGRVIHLLGNEKITGRDGKSREVVPNDIAVLVPTHTEAANVAEALRRAKVPAVRTRTGSVLETPAVLQWRLLLAALARPHHAPTVRAAALGWFFAAEPHSLTGTAGDVAVARLQEQCAQYADRMRKSGVAAAYDSLKATAGLVRGVVARDGGDRDLTDLDHLAELLAQRTHRANTEPAQVLRLLEEMLVNGDDRSEETMRRVESDAQAVQITTIHAAKGLEYPIVLVPFAFKCRNDVSTPYSYTGDSDERTIDIASLVNWSAGPLNQAARKRSAEEGNDGDGLRLIYVALTRARHRVELWWACATRWQSSPLARLLLDREPPASPVLNSCRPPGGRKDWKPPYQLLSRSEVEQRVRDLVDASSGVIELTELPEKIAPLVWSPGTAEDAPPLAIASRQGRDGIGDDAWRRWSFTGLSRRIGDADAVAHPTDQVEPPMQGGADEHAPDDSPGPEVGVSDRSTGASAPGVSFADVAGSARFGTFVHSLLEKLDFTLPDLERELAERVSRAARRDGLQLDQAAVVAGLVSAIHTPLGLMFSNRSLREIGRRDRLDELSFDLPLAHRSTRSPVVTFPAGAVATVLLDELAADDPLRPSLTALAGDLAHVDVGGWMYGSIDAVLRIVTDQPRFFVVDYKTNRLHESGAADPLAAYAPEVLHRAMGAHHYPLQAVLYLVALHRYLRWRLGATYDPDVHLGGVGYLFLRGMVGASGSSGVFAWRPATRAVLALDRLFAEGRAA